MRLSEFAVRRKVKAGIHITTQILRLEPFGMPVPLRVHGHHGLGIEGFGGIWDFGVFYSLCRSLLVWVFDIRF